MLYTEPNIKMHVNYSLKKFSWEKIHISKGQRKVFNCQFSKVNALGKQKSGDGCREETCLEFRQTEGDIKSIVLGFPLSHRTVHKIWMKGEPPPPPSQWMCWMEMTWVPCFFLVSLCQTLAIVVQSPIKLPYLSWELR